MASQGYRLLREWNCPPGLRSDGTLDAARLAGWLDAVIAECSRTGHLKVATTVVGRVLWHAPADPSGLWIDRNVAALLNAQDAKELRDGFWSEMFESRGVHYADPNGEAERELAKKYRGDARAVRSEGFHRLAERIESLADGYDREADQIIARRHHGGE